MFRVNGYMNLQIQFVYTIKYKVRTHQSHNIIKHCAEIIELEMNLCSKLNNASFLEKSKFVFL